MSSTAILPPTRSGRYPDFEYSVHLAPKSMLRELRSVFSELVNAQRVLVVPTCQKASVSLIEWGDEEARQKDVLLERFLVWSAALRDELAGHGFWADATDPCTGLPYFGAGAGSIYPDAEGHERLLHYQVDGSTGCRIVSHPQWNLMMYPATFFTTAPDAALLRALERLNHNPTT